MVKILISEPSYLVRKGLINILNEIKGGLIVKETAASDDIKDVCKNVSPHIIIINTSLSSVLDMEQIASNSEEELVIISVFNSPLNANSSNTDISIFDTKSTLLNKLGETVKTISTKTDTEEASEDLSERERDVLKEIALGKTNKEIASNLFISTHTVISHRKNITRKLGIKTVSGLTVYAIINQLIVVEDIS